MFGLFKKKETESASAQKRTQEEIVHKVNLSKEKVKVSLRKRNISTVKARFIFVLDRTGSFRWAYDNGTIQNTTERLLPVAMEMDDNGEMEFAIFNNSYKFLETVTIDNINNYVKNYVENHSYGGTSYAPIINAIVQKYGKENKSDIPTFVVFITDGDNDDKKEAEKAMIEASNYNIFWKYVGVGNDGFTFLKKLDDMQGRTVDNADFITISDLNSISDEELYDRLLNEYDSWLSAIKAKGI